MLVTVALRHAASLTHGGASPLDATVDGYVLAFRIGAAVLLAGAVLIAAAFQHINAVSPSQPGTRPTGKSRGA